MDTTKEPTAEELAAEQTALASSEDSKKEEIKQELIKEFGWDETDNAAVLEKAIERELKSRKALATAIRQKIDRRNEANELRNAAKPADASKTSDIDIDKKLDERLAQRDLEALDLPDNLKAEVKKVSTTLGISIKQALAEPYLDFKIKEHEKATKVDNATIGKSKGGGGGTSSNFDINTPPDVDMTTKEGREKWDAWKAEAKKKGF